MERPVADNAISDSRTARTTPQRSASIGAIDLGTNNCRLLIARPRADGFHVIDSYSRTVRLGDQLDAQGALGDDAMERAIEALGVCADKLRRHGVRRMRAVATEACRRARNGRAFIERVRRETGLRLEVISAEEESRLAVAGCAPLLDEAAEQVLVVDIGGGSTELVLVDLSGTPAHLRPRLLMALAPTRRGMLEADARARAAAAHIVDWISAPSGVATLHERFAHIKEAPRRFEAMRVFFEAQIAAFAPRRADWRDDRCQIIGASGTVTTIAGVHLGLRRYDRSRVDGLWLPTESARRIIARLAALEDGARSRHPGVGAERAVLLLAGAAILSGVMALWPAEKLRVADRGLREGMLYALLGESADPAQRRAAHSAPRQAAFKTRP